MSENKGFIRNLPYYSVRPSPDGIKVKYWNDTDNRVFKFCPFCGTSVTEG